MGLRHVSASAVDGLPVVDVQLGHLDELRHLQQVLVIPVEMGHAADVAAALAVHRRHVFERAPVGDDGELGDVAVEPAEHLDAEIAGLHLDGEDAVLVEVGKIFVRDLAARAAGPDAADQWLSRCGGGDDRLLAGAVESHPVLLSRVHAQGLARPQ